TRLAPLLHDRDRRLAVAATVGIAVALAATLLAPAVLFALSPIVLGVPHIAADVRYLVLRRGLPRWWTWSIAGACLALVALRGVQELAARSAPGSFGMVEGGALLRAEVTVGTGWLVVAALAGAWASGAWRRALLVLPVAGAVAWVAQLDPWGWVLVLTHLHNVAAVVLWLLLFRRAPRAVLWPLLLLAVLTAVLASGLVNGAVLGVGGHRALGVDMRWVAGWLAPGLPASLALGLTLTYVFLQAIHYSVWLGWVPQEDVRGEGTLTFGMSLRSLRADFGVAGVLLVAAGALAVAVCASMALVRTRDLYLSVTGFHAYLELAMLAYLFTARGVPARARRAARVPAAAATAA
ncbi:MAG: hypothetical protein WKG00_41550, partial [Polyangiaceae bacterium]